MKKMMLSFIVAVLCCAGVLAQTTVPLSGTGASADDPQVFPVTGTSDVITVDASLFARFVYSAYADGELTVQISSYSQRYNSLSYKATGDDSYTKATFKQSVVGGQRIYSLAIPVEAGKQYVMETTKFQGEFGFTFTFEEGATQPLQLSGVQPADKSALDKIENVTFMARQYSPDKAVFMDANDPEVYEEVTPVQGGASCTVTPAAGSWTLYEGHTYYLVLTAPGMGSSVYKTYLTYTGTAKQEQPAPEVDGDGTEANPWIAIDGGKVTYEPNADMTAKPVFIEYAPEVDGYLYVYQSSFGFFDFGYKEKDSAGDYARVQQQFGSEGTWWQFPVEGGKTYTIASLEGNNASMKQDLTFKFEAVEGGLLKVVEADPAAGSTLEGFAPGDKITVKLNKGYGYLRAHVDDPEMAADVVELVPVEGAENTYTFGPTDWSDIDKEAPGWTFYEGVTYDIVIEAWNSKEDCDNYEPVVETAKLQYVGSAKAVTYSDIKVISVSPDPNETDKAKMLSSTNNKFTVEFSGEVDIKEISEPTSNDGENIPITNYETTVNGEGHTVLTITYDDIADTDFQRGAYIVATDKDGNALHDMDGLYSGSFVEASGAYSFTIACADGRTADMSLTYSDVDPAEGSYFIDESWTQVTFKLGNGQSSYGDGGGYAITPGAKGRVIRRYNAGTELEERDVLFSIDGDVVTAKFCKKGTVDQEAGTGTGQPISQPDLSGAFVYVLQIDPMSFGDGNFEYDNYWMTQLDGSKGRCNPAWEMEFHKVSFLAGVSSVSPEPYNVSGEFNEEIPQEIEITVQTTDASGNVVEGKEINVQAVQIAYGQNQNINVPASTGEGDGGYTVDIESGVIIVPVPEELKDEKSITVFVTATTQSGAPIVYGAEDGLQTIMLVYQKPKNILTPTSVTPDPDNAVQKLSEVTMTFANTNIGEVKAGSEITLTDNAGVPVAVCTIDVGQPYDGVNTHDVVVMPDKEITEAGVYTLTIPEGTIYDENADLYNPGLTIKFTVDPTLTSIDGITVNADGTVKIYTVDGVYVGEGPAAEMLGKLAKGVYIVNGTKIVKN